MSTLVDSIASTIFETEYAMRWTQAIVLPGMSAIVERHRRNARLSIEATGQFIDMMGADTDEDAQAQNWIAGFLLDAALVQAGVELKKPERYPATT